MATAAQVREFREANQALVELAQRDLSEFWGSLDLSGDPTRIRNLMLEVFPELVIAYGDTAAVIGADWYDMLRDAPPSASSFRAIVVEPVAPERAQGSARWGLGPLFHAEPDPDTALSLLSGSLQRLVVQPGRDAVYESAVRDPSRPRFARIPTGAVTCRFCTMVASRGFVYSDAASAGESNRWHDNCNCVIVPGRGADDYPEGHDLNVYLEAYRAGSGIGRDVPAD